MNTGGYTKLEIFARAVQPGGKIRVISIKNSRQEGAVQERASALENCREPTQSVGIIEPVFPGGKMIGFPDGGMIPLFLSCPYKSAAFLFLLQITDACFQDILAAAEITQRHLAFLAQYFILCILLHRKLQPSVISAFHQNLPAVFQCRSPFLHSPFLTIITWNGFHNKIDIFRKKYKKLLI